MRANKGETAGPQAQRAEDPRVGAPRELREKVRAYEAPPESVELPKGVVRLGRKTDDGRVVPVGTTAAGPAE